MAIRIAINGYGRIGRCILRAIYEANLTNDFEIVAINDLGSPDINTHLTKYDTTHGRLAAEIYLKKNEMIVNGNAIKVFAERNPMNLPWKLLNIDVVFECTGLFTSKKQCDAHIQAGAKKVVISAPGAKDVDATIVYGVNHNSLSSNMTVISNASCTTNCLAPIAKVLDNNIGIQEGLMTTIHAYTNDQKVVDSYHKDFHRARAAAHNMIPTKTGAAAAVGLVLPNLQGILDGFAMRVPTINVSVVDLTFYSKKLTSVEEVNNLIKSSSIKGDLIDVLDYNVDPLVSTDFNHSPYPSIFDATQTRVIGNLVKVLSWYDNEWGFSNQMLRITKAWFQLK